MESGMAFEPGLHLFMFVCGVVVHDQMDVQALWGLTVDEIKKLDPLLMVMLLHTGGDNPSLGHFDGRKKACWRFFESI